MNAIRYKKEAVYFLKSFTKFAGFDEEGDKYYFVFSDSKLGGNTTIMYYKEDNRWTYHNKGEDYCDETETPLTFKEASELIYKSRKQVNASIKELAA